MDAISLGNEEFEGRNNAYLLDGEPVTLVDTGIATSRTREQLREELSDRGYDFSDVEQVVLTHWHPDHAGLAGEIQAESDATVYAHAADAPLIEGDEEALAALDERRRSLVEQWGMPAGKREELLDFLDSHDGIGGEPAEVTRIEDGTTIETGETVLETIHAPGHAAGLCCFEVDGGREAFVGDAILPVYTPNVGGADVRVDRPLERYLDSLRTLIERDYERVWPGHRDVIEAPSDRAREIASHHRERTERVLEVLDEHGPADAWTVSAHLFGELEGIHVVHGPGEAFAHLDHLERAGALELDGREYVLVSEPDLDSLLSSA
jgi:glyoxylase-like metal-dependent hydrolase (beta-lactamase superfamily II)